MGTEGFPVDSQVDMATWRQVRVCFLCSLKVQSSLCQDTTLPKFLLVGKGAVWLSACKLPLLVSKGKGFGHLLRGRG